MHLRRRQFRLRHNPIFHFYHKFQKGCVHVGAALLGLFGILTDTARCVPACTGSVENVPLERFQYISAANGTQGGAVLFAPPSKSYRFSHPPSPCARSMAQGVSLSADSDSEGYSPSKRVYFASRCMQIALSDFLRDERKSGRNPLWISEHFPEISRKRCKQGACE